MNRILAGRFLAALLITGLFACSKPLTVEQQVIAVIREMEARIENGERRPFMSHVTEDFEGQNGGLTRDQLARAGHLPAQPPSAPACTADADPGL